MHSSFIMIFSGKKAVWALVPLSDDIKLVNYELLPFDLLVFVFAMLSKDEAKTENPQYAKPEPSERRDSNFITSIARMKDY